MQAPQNVADRSTPSNPVESFQALFLQIEALNCPPGALRLFVTSANAAVAALLADAYAISALAAKAQRRLA